MSGEVKLIVLPGINHRFIGKTPEQTRKANLKRLKATFRFFDKSFMLSAGELRRGD
jgi:dipeptidyl aminopeptidase/acylaminoacyl peptidase